MSLATTGLHRSPLPFDAREVWGKAKVPVKVTINGYTWRSTVGNRGGIQYIVVDAAARFHAGVKAGDVVTIILEPDTEKRDIEVPIQLRRLLGIKLTEKLNRLSDKSIAFIFSTRRALVSSFLASEYHSPTRRNSSSGKGPWFAAVTRSYAAADLPS